MDEPTKHITEALGGRRIEPLGRDELVEFERVRNLIRAVVTCYNSLISRETADARRAELEAERDSQVARFRRGFELTADERREVLDGYPELLVRLRADIDG